MDIDRESNAVEALRQSEASYRRLIELFPDPIVIHRQGTIVFVNEAYMALLGISDASEVLGKYVLDFVHPDHREGSRRRMQEFADSKTVMRAETRFACPDGREPFIEVIACSVIYKGEPATQVVFRDITNRKQTQRLLQETADRLTLATQAGGVGIWEYDIVANRLIWDDQMFRLYGITREQFSGVREAWSAAVHPKDRQSADEAFEMALRDAKDFTLGFSVLWPNGSTHHIRAYGRVQCDATGKATRIVGTNWDITERNQILEMLKESEERYRLIYDQAPDGILMMTSAGVLTDVNEAYAKMHGYTVPEILSLALKDLIVPECLSLVPERLRRISAGELLTYEVQGIHKDGHIFPIENTARRISFGGKICIQYICRDVTERKRTESMLRLENAALEAVANAIVITNNKGVIEWVNPAFTTYTGYSAAEAIGNTPRLLKSGEAEKSLYEELWATIVAGKSWHGEMINKRKDGSFYNDEMTITPLLDTDGAITHFIAIKQDITERKQLEAQFRQSQKMESIGQLAGAIAHDFNNVLNVISGYSELLLEDIGSNESHRDKIQEIQKAVKRAASLIQQLLAFSRRQVLRLRAANLNNILQEVETMLWRIIGENIELRRLTDPSLGIVTVDPTQMEQTILNLAVNARDAMPRGGTLTVETANVNLEAQFLHTHGFPGTPGNYVMLSVSDTGVGMDAATQEQIFEPFFTTKGPGKGTGLGLSTVYGIVKQSGGFIEVKSELNRGTSFRIYLPRVDETPQAISEDVPLLEETKGTETILVVDDDIALCEVLSKYLVKKGYTVQKAHNGKDAIRIAENYPGEIHMLITDVIMPGMSGAELASQLVAARPDMKVLYVSGYAHDAIANHGVLDAGVTLLQKPYNLADLDRKIRSLLQ